MPSVSYVVSTYNKEQYIGYLLQGLASQQGDFEREFIFVDDGSTDQTVSLLRAQTEGWKNVVILEQENAGPARAMNKGFSLARNDFIKVMDADDILAPWATDYLLRAVEETKCAMAYSPNAFKGSYQSGSSFSFPETPPYPGAQKEIEFFRKASKGSVFLPAALLVRTDKVREVGGCDEDIFIQDLSLQLRLSCAADTARIDLPIFFAPESAPGRLSDNEAQTMHDTVLALARFLIEHPDLPQDVIQACLWRMTRFSWRWAKKQGDNVFSKAYFMVWATRLGLISKISPKFVETVCAPYFKNATIRTGIRRS